MNIIKLTSDNMPGLKNLLVLDAARVVAAGERPVGINVNEGICFYSDSPAKYVEGVKETIGFNETTELVEGVPMYKQVASCIIPKDRPELMNQFMNWANKRWIVLARDFNGYTKMIGTRLEPAQFFIAERSTGTLVFNERNEIAIGFTVTRKDPAYNYTVQTQVVESVGAITIGKRIFTP